MVRNLAKMVIQNGVLPIAYELAKLRHKGEKTLYVFTDALDNEKMVRLPATARPPRGYWSIYIIWMRNEKSTLSKTADVSKNK